MGKTTLKKNSNGGNLGFEEKLWQAADKMRGHMDPAEYKHVVLGLIFLKYISDAFEERYNQLKLLTAFQDSVKVQPLKKSALMAMSLHQEDMSALRT